MEIDIDASAEELGFCADRLGRIPTFLNSYIEQKKLAGLSVLIARGDRPVLRAYMGQKDWDTAAPIEDDTIFRIYSMTKPVTSVGLMMLYEQGLVRMEHEVSRYLPEFADMRIYSRGDMETMQTVAARRPILVRDLLTQTSGLTYDFMFQHPVDRLYRARGLDAFRADMPLKDFVGQLAQMPLLFEPGSRWNYSFATDVCGRLIEVISGQSLETYFTDKIFTPLGMSDTGFAVSQDKVARFASCYEKLASTGEIVKQDSPEDSKYVTGRKFQSGGGGLVSTLDDYYRFCRMLLNGGELDGARPLSPTTIDFMTINHLPENKSLHEMGDSLFTEVSTNGAGFGLGFSVVMDPTQTMSPVTAGSYSWGGAASTYFWIDPQEELIGILMTQLIPSTAYPIRPQLQTLAYAAITE